MPKETKGNAQTRLRASEIQRRVLDAAFESVLRIGFRAVTVESISAETGIAKTSIYRRWPNKDAMVMDALYAGLYYRLLTGSGPLSDTYVEGLFSHVIEGLRAVPRTPVSRAVEITQRKRSR